jgi:hypothetical protein
MLMENPESQSVRLSLARSSTTSPDTLAKLAEGLGKGAIPYNPYTEAILCALASLSQHAHSDSGAVCPTSTLYSS